MNKIAIHTENLTRSFGELHAVDRISFEVPSGTVFGFLGPNGSGKTTTIRLLLGLLAPSSGSAQVLGYDVRTQSDEIRQRSGALLEHSGLYERLSAEDNLELFGRIWHLPAATRKARIDSLLNNLGLWERRRENVGTWSRGMKQKLAIARALLHEPQLVFLDEPTAGLDPVAAANLRNDLAALAKQKGVTVFLTTHNLSEAENLCTTVAVIRQGKLLSIGSPDELRLQEGGLRLEITGQGFTPQVIAGLKQFPQIKNIEQKDHHLLIDLADQMDTAPLVQYLVQQGVLIDEIRKGKASLEEAFLALLEEQK